MGGGEVWISNLQTHAHGSTVQTIWKQTVASNNGILSFRREGGWRDNSEVKSTNCSGPNTLYGSSQPPLKSSSIEIDAPSGLVKPLYSHAQTYILTVKNKSKSLKSEVKGRQTYVTSRNL